MKRPSAEWSKSSETPIGQHLSVIPTRPCVITRLPEVVAEKTSCDSALKLGCSSRNGRFLQVGSRCGASAKLKPTHCQPCQPQRFRVVHGSVTLLRYSVRQSGPSGAHDSREAQQVTV